MAKHSAFFVPVWVVLSDLQNDFHKTGKTYLIALG
jgi:hypothetical protein